MSTPRRHLAIALLVTLFPAIGHLSCDSDAVGNEQPDFHLDAGDVASTDGGLDAYNSDGSDGDSASPLPCADELNQAPSVFTALSDRRAVNSANIGGVVGADRTVCGSIALLDISQKRGSDLLDLRVYKHQVVQRTLVNDRLIAIASKFPEVRKANKSEQNIIADVYEIEQSGFRRLNRTSNLFARPLDPTVEFRPLSLVNDGESLVLVGSDKFARLSLNSSGEIEVTRIFDREADMRNLTGQLVNKWEQRDDPERFKPKYEPGYNRHLLLHGGYLVEIEQGISIWDVSADTAGKSDPEILVDYLRMYLNLTPGLFYGSGGSWDYNPNTELLYLGDALESEDLPDDPPIWGNEIEVVDISEPENPTVVNRWHAGQDFSRSVVNPIGAAPDVTFSNGYLFIFFSPEPIAGFQGIEYLTVLDVEEHPTTVHEVYSKNVNSFFDSSMNSMHAEDGRLFWAPITSPSSDAVKPIRWRPISEVLASQ